MLSQPVQSPFQHDQPLGNYPHSQAPANSRDEVTDDVVVDVLRIALPKVEEDLRDIKTALTQLELHGMKVNSLRNKLEVVGEICQSCNADNCIDYLKRVIILNQDRNGDNLVKDKNVIEQAKQDYEKLFETYKNMKKIAKEIPLVVYEDRYAGSYNVKNAIGKYGTEMKRAQRYLARCEFALAFQIDVFNVKPFPIGKVPEKLDLVEKQYKHRFVFAVLLRNFAFGAKEANFKQFCVHVLNFYEFNGEGNLKNVLRCGLSDSMVTGVLLFMDFLLNHVKNSCDGTFDDKISDINERVRVNCARYAENSIIGEMSDFFKSPPRRGGSLQLKNLNHAFWGNWDCERKCSLLAIFLGLVDKDDGLEGFTFQDGWTTVTDSEKRFGQYRFEDAESDVDMDNEDTGSGDTANQRKKRKL